MGKGLRIIINILIFAIITGFVVYMVSSINGDKPVLSTEEDGTAKAFQSPYKQTNIIKANDNIICFDLFDNHIYTVHSDSVSVFTLSGKRLCNFAVEANVRDIALADNELYLLYPTKIAVYSPQGEKIREWEACSDNSDYCALALASGYVFVTDAANKNICKYTLQGNFAKFINSPNGFIIPSYSFDIININDTLYCSNSGKHKIESYTIDGEFIASFGKSGAEAGAFAGCCNPVYLCATPQGAILTSEKGSPRISCYDKSGKYRTVLFNSLGGTSAYQMKTKSDNIYISKADNIIEYTFDTGAANSACEGCTANCALRKGVN